MKICYHSKAACQIGWAAGMFTFQLLTRKQWKHKQIIFWIIWIFSILAQSVELRSNHSCVCTYLGCVTAVVQPTSPLLRNVYSSAQMCVQLSGWQQTDSSQHLECHLCQSVHPSQVLHQPPVVNWLFIPSYSVLIWHRQFRVLLVHLLSHAGSGSSGEGETTTQPPPSAGLAGQVNCSTLQCQEGYSCSIVRNTSLCLPACVWKLSWHFIGHQCCCHPFSSCWLCCHHSSAWLSTCIRWNRM